MPSQQRYLKLLLYILVFLGIYATINLIGYLIDNLSDIIFHRNPFEDYKTYDWKSPYTGWYNRTTLIPSPSNIHLNASSLVLICQNSAWGEDYFYLALFQPDLCLTDTALLRMNSTDFEGISNLVTQAMRVRKTYYNMAPNIFDISTQQLDLQDGNTRVKKYHAYGFHKTGSRKGADSMPDILWELFGLTGYEELGDWKVSDGNQMKRLLDEVKEIQT